MATRVPLPHSDPPTDAADAGSAGSATAARLRLRRARALSRRAQAAAQAGRDAFAMACLQRALALAERAEHEDPAARLALRLECSILLGDLNLRTHRHAESLEAYLQALRLAPTNIDVHLALAHALSVQALFPEAIPVLERALTIAPSRADIHLALGEALAASIRSVDDAREASESAPARPAPLASARVADAPAQPNALGSTPLLSDDLPAARSRAAECYERALQLDPVALAAYRGLARLWADAGDDAQALVAIERGLAAAPASDASAALPPSAVSAALHAAADQVMPHAADLWIEKARLWLRRGVDGDATRAVQVLRAVLNGRPRDVDASRLLIEGLERVGRGDDLVGAWFARGAALEANGIEAGRADGELREAARAYEAALALKGDCLRAWLKLADVQLALGEPGAAVRSLEAAVAIDPEQPAAHVNLGWARRMAGDFVAGWIESAWHYRAGDKRRFEQPVWDGSPLDTQTLLLWADFALGDTIQDLRFLPLIRAAHPRARLIVECSRRLASLVEASQSTLQIDAIVTTKAPLPAFDRHLPLRRLPERFAITLDAIPAATPYLAIDSTRVAQWRQRLDQLSQPAPASAPRRGPAIATRKTIGIVWAGDQTRADARVKSAALADFAPLAALHRDGVRLISLQLGPHVDELIAPPRGLRVARPLDETTDVADSAAIMRSLDLVITVDTMIAHLAGALGVPVWVLTAHAPAWWLWHVMPPDSATGAIKSRWYPTMRLFQQTRAGDWAGVMQQLCAALRAEL